MKVILTTLNSKFIHSCLAIRYLKSYIEDIITIELKEYTINQNIDFIASDLYKCKPDIIGFSTYIWNLNETLKICEILKIVNPNIKIILGGPEVSYDGVEVLKNNPFIDFIVYGEGEETFRELMEPLINKKNNFQHIKGLIYRSDDEVVKNQPRPLITDLNKIPTPYKTINDEFENKIVYFESSRGCPFKCEFCLSSTIKGVRYFDINRVKEELGKLIDGKVKQVKFVDRTFNANKKYAMEIMNFIIDKNPQNMNFHFEVTAHLLDDEMLEFLSKVKEGLFQLEVGVQSTNPNTIEAVGRTTDFDKLRSITKRIKSFNNIHQHLDLIAGLPYEDYQSFRKSFNQVYEIKPEKIQLGFLKLLKGSGLRINQEKHGFKYLNNPPYEILENNYIKYHEIIKLKAIEELVERYYNEGYFEHSLEYVILNHYTSPFDFYEEFSEFWESKEYHKVSNSRVMLYEIFLEFFKFKNFENTIIFIELLRYDFIKNNHSSKMPRELNNNRKIISQRDVHTILKDEKVINEFLVGYEDLPTKKVLRDVTIESFHVNIFEIIENGYNPKCGKEAIVILFIYQEGVINRCNTYNISHITKELI